MKTLLLNSERGWRGGEHQTLLLARGLAARGVGVAIAAFGSSPLARRAAEAGIPVVETAFEPVPVVTPFRIAGACRREGFDILHAQTSRAHTHCRLARAIGGARVALVVSRRTAFPVSRGPAGRFKYLRGVDRYLPISKAAASRLRDAGVDERLMTVVPSGIETTRFLALGRNDGARRERGLDGRVVAGTIAAATPEKGLDVLARAGTILAGEPGGVEIVLLALSPGGWEMPNLRRVDPAETPVEGFLSLLDLYVAPSREEGLSTALMAAIAAGLPVVGSRTGGIPEIAGEDHAVLVPPGDPAALAREIRSLAENGERRRDLGRRARERGRLFDIEATVDGTLAVYREILASSDP